MVVVDEEVLVEIAESAVTPSVFTEETEASPDRDSNISAVK